MDILIAVLFALVLVSVVVIVINVNKIRLRYELVLMDINEALNHTKSVLDLNTKIIEANKNLVCDSLGVDKEKLDELIEERLGNDIW